MKNNLLVLTVTFSLIGNTLQADNKSFFKSSFFRFFASEMAPIEGIYGKADRPSNYSIAHLFIHLLEKKLSTQK